MSKLAELANHIAAQARSDHSQGNARPVGEIAEALITQNSGKVRFLGMEDLRNMVAEALAPPKKVEATKKASK